MENTSTVVLTKFTKLANLTVEWCESFTSNKCKKKLTAKIFHHFGFVVTGGNNKKRNYDIIDKTVNKYFHQFKFRLSFLNL